MSTELIDIKEVKDDVKIDIKEYTDIFVGSNIRVDYKINTNNEIISSIINDVKNKKKYTITYDDKIPKTISYKSKSNYKIYDIISNELIEKKYK